MTITEPDLAEATVVARGMRPLQPPVGAHSSVETVRKRLAREGLSFLVVVVGGLGRMVGVVTPESVRPGPCCARRDGQCSVFHHLAEGTYCFADESLAEVRETEAEIAAETGARHPAPLIVVDPRLRPLGYLPAEEPALQLAEPQAA